MAKIKLFDRTELPPTRVGKVKPPLALAEGEGLAQVGAGLAKFAGAIFEDLKNAKAAMEISTFHGEVNTEMEKFSTFVAANPAASFEELQTERDSMMSRLEASGQTSTTTAAKRNNANWFARNKTNIHAQTQTSMEGIRARQQLATYGELQQNNIARLDKGAYIALKNDALASNLLEANRADAQQVQDFAVIDRAESTIVVDNASGLGFEAWQERGDLQDAFDIIDALPITGEEKERAENSVVRRVRNREAQAATELEANREETRNEIVDRFVNKNFVEIEEFINNSVLDGAEKELWLTKSEARAEAVAKGEDDPFLDTDFAFQASLLRRGDYTKADLDAALGKGKNRGLSIAVYNSMLKNIAGGPRARDAAYKQGTQVLTQNLQDNFYIPLLRIGDKDPVTGKKATAEDVALAKGDNSLEWSKAQARFDKWYDDYLGKFGFTPDITKINDWLAQDMFPVMVETINRSFIQRSAGVLGLFTSPGTVPLDLIAPSNAAVQAEVDRVNAQIQALSFEDKAALEKLAGDGVVDLATARKFLEERNK